MGPDSPNYQTTKNKKSRSWLWIVLLIVLVILAGALIAYFADKHNKKTTASTTSTTTPATTSTPSFAPATNSNQPYTATVSTNAGGSQKSATLISDGQGNYSYSYKANGQSLTTIYTPTAYYLCTGSTTCIKYTTSASTSGFDPSSYQYDTTKIENLKNTAAYKGQQSCPSGGGTCDVWSVSNGGTTSTVYINTSSKRIVRATTSSGTTSSDVTYDYKSVHIAIPTNYTTLPKQ